MKIFKIMGMLMGGLMVLSSLSSCDKDKSEVLKAKSAKADYVVSLSQDLLDAATVTVFYIDSNGEQAQENVTATTWTKSVTITQLPAQAGFSVQPQLKGEASKDEYIIEATGQMIVTVLDQKQNPIGSPFTGNKKIVKGELGPDYLGQYLTRITTRLVEAKAMDADGKFSDATINWGGNTDGDDPNRDTEVTTDGATGTTRGYVF